MAAFAYKEKARLVRHSFIILFFGSLITVLGYYQLDQRIDSFFQQPEQETIYYYSREITNIGYSSHYIIICLVLLIVSRFFSKYVGYLNRNPRIRLLVEQWSLFLLRALLAAGILVQMIKPVVGRRRPHVTENPELLFNHFTTDPHWHSFPSGHTQVLMTVATALALIWPKARWFFLVLGLVLAFTRVVIYQHFFSDYLGGILAGYLVTLWVYYKWPPRI